MPFRVEEIYKLIGPDHRADYLIFSCMASYDEIIPVTYGCGIEGYKRLDNLCFQLIEDFDFCVVFGSGLHFERKLVQVFLTAFFPDNVEVGEGSVGKGPSTGDIE